MLPQVVTNVGSGCGSLKCVLEGWPILSVTFCGSREREDQQMVWLQGA